MEGFEASLYYDTSKYAVNTQNTSNPNVLLNTLPSKGEIVISMAAASENLVMPTEMVNISFTCNDKPLSTDFSFSVSDVYMIADNYDSESVTFSTKETWSGSKLHFQLIRTKMDNGRLYQTMSFTALYISL